MNRLRLSSFNLKFLAAFFMLADHISFLFFDSYPVSSTVIGSFIGTVFHAAGRIAFPLFLFCLTEGFMHTHNQIRYLLRLAAAAVISEIPYDFFKHGSVFYLRDNNVIWTLFLVVLMYFIFDRIRSSGITDGSRVLMICHVAVLSAIFSMAAIIGHVDYGASAIWAGVILYFCHAYKCRAYALAVLALSVVCSPLELFGFAGLPLVKAYDGTKGRQLKYFFYVFYPLHMLILRLIYIIIF